MADLTAQRTLVKSPPELWAELSEVDSLARHLGELGEIRITKVEPETTVAWEGEQISGTVQLEQSGWGTKVTFHATVPEPEAVEPPPEPEQIEPEPEPEPVPIARIETASAAKPFATVEFDALTAPASEPTAPEPPPEAEAVQPETAESEAAQPKRRGFLTRWLFRPRGTAEPAPAPPTTVAEAAKSEPVEPEAVGPVEAEAVPEPVATEPAPEPKAELVQEPAAEPAHESEPEGFAVERVQEVLDGTLDSLGQAHHRPFSRG